MALIALLTPAELELVRGPVHLTRYGGESFPWLHRLRRGACDWNTLISVNFDDAQLHRIADFFLAATTPRHEDVRRAAAEIRALARLKEAAAGMFNCRSDATLAMKSALVETRIVQEWEAWLTRLCHLIEQEQRITRQVRSRLHIAEPDAGRAKRDAAAAELEPGGRPAPLPIDD